MDIDTIIAHTKGMVEQAKAVVAITSYDALLAQCREKSVLRFVTEKLFIQILESSPYIVQRVQ
jgi:hypothetical protein